LVGDRRVRRPLAAAAVALATALVGSFGEPPAGAAPGGAERSQARSLRGQLSTLGAAESRALLELYAADAAVTAADRRSEALAAEARAARAEVERTQRTLEVVRRNERIARRLLAERLRFWYRSGEVDTVTLVLSAGSLTSALRQMETLERLSAEDAEIIHEARIGERRVGETLRLLERARARAARTAAAAATEEQRLRRVRSERTELLGDLRRRRTLTVARIGQLERAALAAEQRAAELARERAEQARRSPPPPPAPAAAGTEGGDAEPDGAPTAAPAVSTGGGDGSAGAASGGARTFTVTAYALRGLTATGVPTQRGVCATDPAVIPLGTRFTVPGYGACVAADTGGAIHGNVVDVWLPTVAEANAWGRRTVTITLG
jgi:3D (Asp-Asp-Asp) domain-containing protein/peptidoglycan hydrolase CwlO-like protein